MTTGPEQHTPLEIELMWARGRFLAALNAMPVRIYTGPMIEAIEEANNICVKLAASTPASSPD